MATLQRIGAFFGFPIWGTTLPLLVHTFLSSHDLSNKRVIPFITHGGTVITALGHSIR